VAKLRTEHDQLLSRRDLLGRLRQEMTGFHPGVRAVLSPTAQLGGLLGTVVSLMDVPKELEQAVESALGARLQNIVAERWEDAEAAIAHLKKTRAGWATFLPLDTVRPRAALSLRPEACVLGVASALIRYDERLRPVFELLLGRTIIVRDLGTARNLLRRRTGASLFVTLEGETVQPSGALTGGARRARSNLMAQEREWRELPKRVATAAERLADAFQTHETCQAQLQELQDRIKAQQKRLRRLQAEHELAHERTVDHAQETREVERERKWHDERIGQTQTELAGLAERERRWNDNLAQAKRAQARVLTRVRELEQQLTGGGEELRRRVAELETHVAVAQRTVHSQRTLLKSHQQNLEQLGQQIEAKRAQDDSLVRELAAMAEQEKALQTSIQEVKGRIAELQRRAEPIREALRRLEQKQRDLERRRTQGMERLNEAELALDRATLERDHLQEQQASLSREIEETLGPIDLPDTISHQLRLSLDDDVIELPHVTSLPEGLGAEIRQLKTRLRRLGHVNPDAPKEYEQLLERQTFLQSQAEDLRGAIASLYEVIQELDAIIERDFKATFDVVNEAFGEYFTKLFNGGSARLVLTEPDNISSTGVDIIAHPPGKRAQSLSLLSGGERALTAVALLFALLRANPVPFCFLDEVDAALDEANVGRFRDLLQEYARTTQFVVITHNRHTIEAASTIYGISMGEQGISQCVSLKLEGRQKQQVRADEAV
ncbi:MAG: AAA family ATPase, partial [Alphaproteobacteria bacterium]